MFDFNDCQKNCLTCEMGKRKKDRDKCNYYKTRVSHYRKKLYNIKNKKVKENG